MPLQNHSANEIENNLDDNGLFLSQKLSDILAIKGFKIVRQNIRSLTGRIDKLPLIASELRSSLQFMSSLKLGHIKEFQTLSLRQRS